MATQDQNSNCILEYPDLPYALRANRELALEYDQAITHIEEQLREIRKKDSDASLPRRAGRERRHGQNDIGRMCEKLVSAMEAAQSDDLTTHIALWRENIPTQAKIVVSLSKLQAFIKQAQDRYQKKPDDYTNYCKEKRREFKNAYEKAYDSILNLFSQKYDVWINDVNGSCQVSEKLRRIIMARALEVDEPSTDGYFRQLLIMPESSFSLDSKGEAKKIYEALFTETLSGQGSPDSQDLLPRLGGQIKWLKKRWTKLASIRQAISSVEPMKQIRFNEDDKTVIREQARGQAAAAN